MSTSPFSIASMKRQQSAAMHVLKRTSTWALRMSGLRQVMGCSGSVTGTSGRESSLGAEALPGTAQVTGASE